MTYQALILLHQLKKVQRIEGGIVWVDVESRKISSMTIGCKRLTSINLSNKWDTIYPTLAYLQEQGLVRKEGSDYYSLTYHGYHYAQNIISSVASFLFRSILVPITVSVITTIVMLKFFGITELTLTFPG